MQDKGKTKEQLINELNEMRREFAEMKSVSVNIADLKRTEEALKQSERICRVIFERSPLGMMRFNSDGIVTDCNQAFLSVTGATRDQVIDFNLLVSLENEEVKKAVRIRPFGKHRKVYWSIYVRNRRYNHMVGYNLYSCHKRGRRRYRGDRYCAGYDRPQED